jgi:hypothetical protein
MSDQVAVQNEASPSVVIGVDSGLLTMSMYVNGTDIRTFYSADAAGARRMQEDIAENNPRTRILFSSSVDFPEESGWTQTVRPYDLFVWGEAAYL